MVQKESCRTRRRVALDINKIKAMHRNQNPPKNKKVTKFNLPYRKQEVPNLSLLKFILSAKPYYL